MPIGPETLSIYRHCTRTLHRIRQANLILSDSRMLRDWLSVSHRCHSPWPPTKTFTEPPPLQVIRVAWEISVRQLKHNPNAMSSTQMPNSKLRLQCRIWIRALQRFRDSLVRRQRILDSTHQGSLHHYRRSGKRLLMIWSRQGRRRSQLLSTWTSLQMI